MKPAFFKTPAGFRAWLRKHHKSAINIAKVTQLTRDGRMQAAGVAAFDLRSEARSRIYTYEQDGQGAFEPALEKTSSDAGPRGASSVPSRRITAS